MDDGGELTGLLPQDVQARVQSLRLAGGVATIVLDVAGLERGARDRLEVAVKDALRGASGISEVRVAMVADKVQRHIIAVGSGKGGVGKSTLSANLAIALARLGKKVGLVDADIYGPSQARLMGNEGERPEAFNKQLIPLKTEWGVPVLSMGHLIEPGKAMAWRGPMVSGALSQLVDAAWGDAEILVVDLPPGTGDVQLTMIQKHKPAGAVIVSTPQDLALIDATRAIQLFETAGVPIVGLVENMSGYACPHCNEISDPFGSGGVEQAAADLDVAFLGRIPLDLSIRRDSDAGKPPAANDTPQGQAFAGIARKLVAWLDAQRMGGQG